METVYIPAKEAGALMRSALRKAFPGTAFSVRMSRGTAYGSFTVGWTDGPTEREVNRVIARFEGQGFDGMTDSSYRHEPILESLPDGFRQVQYGTRYLHTSRHHSDAFTAWAVAQEAAYWDDYATMPEYERQRRLWQRMSRTRVTATGYESTEQESR